MNNPAVAPCRSAGSWWSCIECAGSVGAFVIAGQGVAGGVRAAGRRACAMGAQEWRAERCTPEAQAAKSEMVLPNNNHQLVRTRKTCLQVTGRRRITVWVFV